MKDISFRIILLIFILSISTCSFSRNKNNNLNIIRKLNDRLRYLQESESDTTTDFYYPIGNHTYVKSSSGLSAGKICAIVIPCVAALVGIGVAAAILGGSAPVPPIASLPAVSTTNIPPPNIVETSVTKLTTPQEMPIQPKIELPPEPIKPIIQPSYPITNIENPVINLPSSNLVPVQQMKLVPIQKVEMVPVKKVEMVPVKEVIPTNQSIKIAPKINTQIQGGQGIQGGDFISAPEGYGTAAL